MRDLLLSIFSPPTILSLFTVEKLAKHDPKGSYAELENFLNQRKNIYEIDKSGSLITIKREVLIGREGDIRTSLSDTSRKHCVIYPHEGKWVVVDQKSRFGTQIIRKDQHHPIQVGDEPVPLQVGDQIMLAQSTFLRVERI
jgi:pSer/pThr/pTyr-binding forkhead associated (FHA) protein